MLHETEDDPEGFWTRARLVPDDPMLLIGRTTIGLSAAAILVTALAAVPQFLGDAPIQSGVLLLLAATLAFACALAGVAVVRISTQERIRALEREALLEEVQALVDRLEERVDRMELRGEARRSEGRKPRGAFDADALEADDDAPPLAAVGPLAARPPRRP